MKRVNFIITGPAMPNRVAKELDKMAAFDIVYSMNRIRRMSYEFYVEGPDEVVEFVASNMNKLGEEFNQGDNETITYAYTKNNYDYMAPLVKEYFGKKLRRPIIGHHKNVRINAHPLEHGAFQSAISEFCSLVDRGFEK